MTNFTIPARVRTRARTTAAAASALSIVLLASGCAFVQQHVGDAWSVTYEVSVDQPVGAELTGTRFDGADARGDEVTTQDVGPVRTATAQDGGSSWEAESIVLAQGQASVTATPAPGATATCRILLDGTREIATATSASPGAPVECTVDTPRFD